MAERTKFFKTTIKITILSEHTSLEHLSLKQAVYEMDEGDCVGQANFAGDEITPRECARLLSKFGSEPGFFQLDDDGNQVEDDGNQVEEDT